MAPKEVNRFLFIASIACATPGINGFPHCDAGPCNKGKYYDGSSGQCLDCPPYTYMDRTGHACQSCFTCMNIVPGSHEIIDNPCTAYSDAVILCMNQFYMVPDGDRRANGICEPCRVCGIDEWEKRACSNYSDTVCCHNDTELAHGECKETSLSFIQGQDHLSENHKGITTNREQRYKNKIGDLLYIVIGLAFLFGIVLGILHTYSLRRFRNLLPF